MKIVAVVVGFLALGRAALTSAATASGTAALVTAVATLLVGLGGYFKIRSDNRSTGKSFLLEANESAMKIVGDANDALVAENSRLKGDVAGLRIDIAELRNASEELRRASDEGRRISNEGLTACRELLASREKQLTKALDDLARLQIRLDHLEGKEL